MDMKMNEKLWGGHIWITPADGEIQGDDPYFCPYTSAYQTEHTKENFSLHATTHCTLSCQC